MKKSFRLYVILALFKLNKLILLLTFRKVVRDFLAH